MTEIAGWVAQAEVDPTNPCRALLNERAFYSPHPPVFRSLPGAAFGRSLRPTLPEDVYDDGPITAGNRFLLVADVRLDNRAQLITDLGLTPNQGANLADSGLLLRAWERWQRDCVDFLVGDFAFAIWDAHEQRLTLVRDPTGQCPLYFARLGKAIGFSSTPAALAQSAGYPVRFNYPRLAAIMAGAPSANLASYFTGVESVLPGHCVELTSSATTQRSYWRPRHSKLPSSKSQIVEQYRELIDEAVTARLRRRTGNVGAHLSSGYDSSAVAATAARMIFPEPLLAFTSAPRKDFTGIVPANRIADESGLAGITARMHGMEHLVVRPTGGALAKLREHIRCSQEPALNVVNLEWWNDVLREAATHDVSTLLTAQLGNLTIHAGGLSVLPEWIRSGHLLTWLTQAIAVRRVRDDVKWRGIMYNSFRPWMPPAVRRRLIALTFGRIDHDDDQFFHNRWAQARDERTQQMDVTPGRYGDRLHFLRMSDPGLHRKATLAIAGIDERDATSDRRLIDFSFSLSPEHLLDKGEYRPLARQALSDRLPREIIDSHTRGLQGADWYERFSRREAQEIIDELSTSHAVGELLDLEKMRTVIAQWPTTGTADERLTIIFRQRLLTALSAGIFVQEFEG